MNKAKIELFASYSKNLSDKEIIDLLFQAGKIKRKTYKGKFTRNARVQLIMYGIYRMFATPSAFTE